MTPEKKHVLCEPPFFSDSLKLALAEDCQAAESPTASTSNQ